jgi:metal-sulfur cluster biosynthetic enzyme
MLNEEAVRTALRKVKDPELNLSIIDLGLVYEVVVEGAEVRVQMTLTSPGCPSGPEIMMEAQRAIEALDGVTSAAVELVWSPYWTPERIDPKVRAYLGLA